MKMQGIKNLLNLALKEDIGMGDITTGALFPKQVEIKAKIIAKEGGVLCGLPVAAMIFKILDKNIRFIKKAREGSIVKSGQTICVIEGDVRSIFTGERVALNFLSRLSGVATLTRDYVNRTRPYKVKIMDTRKTAPGLRQLEKYAVKTGGGHNHRMGLWDQVLVKDNHLMVASRQSPVTSIANLVARLRKKTKKKVEIEVENLRQFKEALEAGPNIIMLDNMSIQDMKKAAALRNKPATGDRRPETKLEASGGVTLDNVRAIAKTGVDMISIGSLTHSVKAIDFSLEVM